MKITVFKTSKTNENQKITKVKKKHFQSEIEKS